MIRFLILFSIIVIMSSAQCENDGENCHRSVQVINNSTSDIIYSLKFYYSSSNNCQLGGETISPNQSVEERLRICWEDELQYGNNFEFYIVDPVLFNAPGVFYPCDSIEIKNKILKHYILSLEDLKATNFIVTYP